tara:strand:- start:21809 stop:22033 length:225 start_codon:yes stop_codon:yes gene_type:complete
MYQPVKGQENWFRDSQSGSFNCADEDTYQKYMIAHSASKRTKEDFTTLQNEVSELKSDMSEIKSLLLTLVQKSD